MAEEKWKDLPKEVEVGFRKPPRDIFYEYPDGFRISYKKMWNLGKPSMKKHWELVDKLEKEHGGVPKFYWKFKN